MTSISGKCLCEQVEFRIDGDLGPIFNCHCTKCRRWHGAAFRTRASIQKSQMIWLSGEDNLSSYNSSENVTKYFCKTCGSPLHSTYLDKPDVLGIPLGGLEGLGGIEIDAHIFTSSKADWYEIQDGITEYEGWPGGEAKVRETAPE